MAIGYFDFTPKQIFKYLQLPGEIQKTSPMIETAETLKHMNADTA